MRISDWSSDVCSSDLAFCLLADADGPLPVGLLQGTPFPASRYSGVRCPGRPAGRTSSPANAVSLHCPSDRQSVESGKSVSVRVDLGGLRAIKKKITAKT